MIMMVGLGNPGGKYARNRHNIGFMAVDEIARQHGFGPFRSRFQGEIAEGRLGEEKVWLLKPMTFMNLSGQSVGEAMRFLKLPSSALRVFHDEIDLEPGKLRLKEGGGHAGHNGLRSIHQHIGPDYGRVRMGVGHPGHKDAVAGYVLRDFAKADEGWLDDMLRGCADGAPALAAGDGPGFLNAVNRRLNPARNSGSTPARAPRPAAPAAGGPPAAQGKAAFPAADSGRPSAPVAEDTRSPLQKLRDRFL